MSGKCNLLLSILYYLLPYLVWKTVPHRAKHPCQSNKSVFGKNSVAKRTRIADITDEKISINKNKQIYFSLFFILMFYSKMTNNHKIWLEANTERSESNPGRSLGISMTYSDCCLEDSTSKSEASASIR